MPNIPLGISLFSIVSLYFIFYRLRFTTQSRAVKSINDEIVKINDFCMEFLETYAYFVQNSDENLDKKDIITLNTLARKIDLHFEYLSNQINNFPYGSVLSQFLKRKCYHKNAHRLFIDYQDKVRADSPLERGIVLFENNKLKNIFKNDKSENLSEDNKSENQSFALFDNKRLDSIIEASNQLNNYLEKHIHSCF